MKRTRIHQDSSLLGFLAVLIGWLGAASCGGSDDDGPGGGGGGAPTGSINGTVVACNMPQPGVRVTAVGSGGTFATTTSGVGRWCLKDVPAGTYRMEIEPPEGNPMGLPPIEYQDVSVGAGSNTFQPVFLPPIVGTAWVTDDSATDQVGLTFHSVPGDPGSAQPLPGLSITVRAGTKFLDHGEELEVADDVDSGTPGIQFPLEIALVPPEQIPMPFEDLEDRPRANQLFFSLQPVGVTFIDAATFGTTNDPMLVEVTYPNVNGLMDGSTVDLFRFDHHEFDWVSAGTGTVDGNVIEPDAGAGLPEAGWHGGPGAPPPTTTVSGRLLQSGAPFLQEGVIVVTNNGLFDFTDDQGRYEILEVPVIGGNTLLSCIAFTDLSLAFEAATSAPTAPAFPVTTIDIEVQGTPVDSVAPTVTGIVPAGGAADVDVDVPVRVTFDEEIDALTLDDAITVEATGMMGGTVEVAGSVIAQSSGMVTEAVFLPAADLPDSSTIAVTVGTGVADLNGNALGAPFISTFDTGTGSSATPDVFTIAPQAGRVGTTITLTGINLDAVTDVLFDGTMYTPDSQSPTQLTLEVPAAEGAAAPGARMVGITGDLFTFELRPSITSITPPNGIPPEPGGAPTTGTLVTIAGHNLAPLDGIVFGAAGAISIPMQGAQSITVHVPEGASSAPVFVEASGASSNPFFFTVEAPIDSTAPTVVSADPPDAATNVNCSATITVVVSELIPTDSTLDVVAGAPPVEVPGTTSVFADGMGRGVLQFVADDAFPSTTDVTYSAVIADLSGNTVAIPGSTFTTGAGTPEECIDQAQADAQAGDLQAARASLEAALAFAGTTPQEAAEARFYLTIVDLALAVDQEGTTAGAAALHDLLERFGFPAGGPDLLDLASFTGPDTLPMNSPTCDEVQDYVSTYLIPALQEAEAEFASLPAFVSTFTNADTLETVEIDRTDVFAARAVIRWFLVHAHLVVAYGCNLDIDELANGVQNPQPNADFLDADQQLLTLQSPADLAEARLAIQAIIDLYDQGLGNLRGETDDQSDDLIIFADPDSEAEALELQSSLQQVLAATNGPVAFDVGDGRTLTVNAGVPSFTTLDIRNQLPVLEDFRDFPAVFDPAFDGTVNGILPGLSANQFPDLVRPFDTVPTVPNGSISLVDGSTADWAAAGITTAAAIDEAGLDDYDADIDVTAVAADCTEIYICQDADSFYFRIDFAAGTPLAISNTYEFDLEGNDRLAGEPDFRGRIVRPFQGNDLALSVFGPFGVALISDDSSLVQVGTSFLEFELPKAPLVAPGGVTDGAEYVFSFDAGYFDFMTFSEASDSAPPIRLNLDLP